MILKSIAIFILGLAAIQSGFAAYVFYLMETEGIAVLRETNVWIRHFELTGSILIAAAITGLLLGHSFTKGVK